MSDHIRKLENDHSNFQKLLDLFEAELGAFHEAEEPDYVLMRDVIHYMTQYPDLFHHPQEDLIFEHLLRAEPGQRAEIEALVKEHEELVATATELLQVLEDLVGDVMMTRDTVESLARGYVVKLREHMLREESKLFPMAAKRLTPQNWAAIDAAIKVHDDPLFGKQVDQKYRVLLARMSKPGA